VAEFHRKTRGIVVLYRCPLKPVKREVPPNRKKRLLRVALARRTDSKIGEQTTKVVRFFAMARRPDREKYELLSENDLKELRRSLAHLSVTAVRDFYERAYQDCRLVYNRLPSPRQMQTLVQVWKQLWKWR
jgi:hypothetical protein